MKKFLYVLLCVLIISPCAVLLSACGTPISYGITVKTSDVRYGSVSGNGTFAENTSVTLRATPLQESEFLCWTLNNKVVSKDAEYTFTVNSENNGTYIALFDKALDYYALTEVAIAFTEGAQIEELHINVQASASLSSLQTIYDVTTNPVVRTQNYSSVPGFYNGTLIHKKTTDTTYYSRFSVTAKHGADVRNYNESFDIDFDALYEDGEYTTETKTLTGYGTITLKFEKVNSTIINHMLGAQQ